MAKQKKPTYESVETLTLQKYRFEVGALQIKELKNIGNESNPDSAGDGRKIVNSSCTIPLKFVLKFKPKVGGYIIINDDGELGYLPKSDFEGNFKKVK